MGGVGRGEVGEGTGSHYRTPGGQASGEPLKT